MSDIYRQAFGAALPTATEPEPEPTIERIPRTYDGCTWYAHAVDGTGERIGATARTKRDALTRFSERWAMFAGKAAR